MNWSVTDIREWAAENPGVIRRPWLVVGKGPSFSRYRRSGCPGAVVVGLNHVAREELPDKLFMLHVFDLDVLDSYTPALLQRTEYLLMPDVPNVAHSLPFVSGTFHKANKLPTAELIARNPLLAEFASRGRLLTYPRGRRDARSRDWPVSTGSFSASTVVELLAKLGVRDLLLAGIDGGTAYAREFDDLASVTRLNAGQASFDLQFAEIAAIRRLHGISIAYFGAEAPRIFVGAQVAQRLAHDVLAYSIDRHASCNTSVYHLGDTIGDRYRGYDGEIQGLPQGTPFSLQRYAIPTLCDFDGRAIYLDSDMQVFTDIRQLWEMPVGPNGYSAAAVRTEWGRPAQLSVMLIDCARTKWSIPVIADMLRGGLDYEAFRALGPEQQEVFRSIPAEWNSLEAYEDGVTCLIHYTSMRDQPWLSAYNPLAPVWCAALIDAVTDGFIEPSSVAQHVEWGFVRPSLLWQVEAGQPDPLLAPARVLKSDRSFMPPHAYGGSTALSTAAGLGVTHPSVTQRLTRSGLARARHALVASGIQRQVRAARRLSRKVRRAFSGGFRAGI